MVCALIAVTSPLRTELHSEILSDRLQLAQVLVLSGHLLGYGLQRIDGDIVPGALIVEIDHTGTLRTIGGLGVWPPVLADSFRVQL